MQYSRDVKKLLESTTYCILHTMLHQSISGMHQKVHSFWCQQEHTTVQFWQDKSIRLQTVMPVMNSTVMAHESVFPFELLHAFATLVSHPFLVMENHVPLQDKHVAEHFVTDRALCRTQIGIVQLPREASLSIWPWKQILHIIFASLLNLCADYSQWHVVMLENC